jgi:hypothetical protein
MEKKTLEAPNRTTAFLVFGCFTQLFPAQLGRNVEEDDWVL